MSSQRSAQVTEFLAAQALPCVHSSFLDSILSGPTRNQPLPAIAATVKHRLLSSDISSSLSPILSPESSYLPLYITEKRVESTLLPYDILVQILDVEDIGRSKWDQIESLELERKGETTKGREIIRVVPSTEEDPSSADNQQLVSTRKSADKQWKGPVKLILQDWKGTKIWAYEFKKIEKLGLPPVVNIGCKLWLKKGCKLARGVLLLEQATVTVLGGKIDVLDKTWKENLETKLRTSLRSTKDVTE